MKKIAALALSLAFVASVAGAQTAPVKPKPAPGPTVVAGGITATTVGLALIPLALLAALNGGSSSSSSSTTN